MRILFSADWHLGYELGGAFPVSRLPDQVRQMRKVAEYCEAHEVDVLAIAGDVFEAQERGQARQVVREMTRVLEAPLARGMTLVAVAGNHDRDYFMETANAWLEAAGGGTERQIILRTRPDIVRLPARGEAITMVLMPFPTPSRYDLSEDDAGGQAPKNQRLGELYLERLEALRQRAAAEQLPVVLLTHITVEGTRERAHRISPRDDIVVPRGRFPSFELTVVGHIHKPEAVSDFCYVGALDRMDIGERDYQPRVLLAEVGPKGLAGPLRSLPLDPTPFELVEASDEQDLEAAAARIPDLERTLVSLRLKVDYGTYTAPLIAAARRLFPRLYGNVEHEWLGAPVTAPSVAGLEHRDLVGTIRRYLEERIQDPQEREALLALVAELRQAEEAQ